MEKWSFFKCHRDLILKTVARIMSFEAFGKYVRKEWSNCIWGTVKDL